jgi:hypothetical protein
MVSEDYKGGWPAQVQLLLKEILKTSGLKIKILTGWFILLYGRIVTRDIQCRNE